MSTITIPRTIGAAKRKLDELGELSTATEWGRSAIVATYVVRGRPGRPANRPETDDSPMESAQAFARRGIHGLTSATTVLIYLDAWLERFDRPRPGSRVELPDDPWEPTRTGTDGYSTPEGAAATIDRIVKRHGPAPIVEVTRQPEVADAIVHDDPAADAMEEARVRRNTSAPGRARIQRQAAAAQAEHERMRTEREQREAAEHEVERGLGAALMHLRFAHAAMERNPRLTAGQAQRVAVAITEARLHLDFIEAPTAENTGIADAAARWLEEQQA